MTHDIGNLLEGPLSEIGDQSFQTKNNKKNKQNKKHKFQDVGGY